MRPSLRAPTALAWTCGLWAASLQRWQQAAVNPKSCKKTLQGDGAGDEVRVSKVMGEPQVTIPSGNLT